MKAITSLGLWLAALACGLLGSGCATSLTLIDIKHPAPRPVPDHLVRVVKAFVTEGNELVIHVEARLTNSASSAQYTVSVPLAELSGNPGRIPVGPTNLGLMGRCWVEREAITPGWDPRQTTNACLVPIGPPVKYDLADLASRCGRRLEMQPTLFPIIEPRPHSESRQDPYAPTAQDPYRGYRQAAYRFVYTDPNSAVLFTPISVEEVLIFPAPQKAKYLFLPLTVAVDIATSPIQAMYFLYFLCGGLGC